LLVSWLDSITAKGSVEHITAGEKVILSPRGSEEVQQVFHRLRWTSDAADDSDVNEQSNDEDVLAKRYQV
jgi:hypothetical protein